MSETKTYNTAVFSMKKKVLIIACAVVLIAAVTLLCTVGISAQKDEVPEFDQALEQKIKEYRGKMSESFLEKYKTCYMYDVTGGAFRPVGNGIDVLSDEMVAGYMLYDGHFFMDWETSGFDETELMEIRIEIAKTTQYYNKRVSEFAKSYDFEQALDLLALQDILADLHEAEAAALPIFS